MDMENIPTPEGPGSSVCSEVALVAHDRELWLLENTNQILFIY